MSQDDGEKKEDSKIARQEVKPGMTKQAENESKGPDDNTPPQHHFPLKGCFITAAIIIAVIVIGLGITCFVQFVRNPP